MHTAEGAAKAARYGVTRVPAVVVNGRSAEVRRFRGIRAEGVR
jgi:hypothetical protein